MIDLSDISNIKANDIADKKIEKLRAEYANTQEQIADLNRKIEQGENKIKRLKSGLSKKERRKRTSRLIGHGAIAEKFVENAAALTNDEFKNALTQAVGETR
jgi:uncharacterized coiled-coil DUF342 family protein